jgi:hypothetical protein
MQAYASFAIDGSSPHLARVRMMPSDTDRTGPRWVGGIRCASHRSSRGEVINHASTAASRGVPSRRSRPGSAIDLSWRLGGRGCRRTGREIQIEPEGPTIVYCANGAGKSTYIRVLKRVLRSVDRDEAVRGDVYADSADGMSRLVVDNVAGAERGDAESRPLRAGSLGVPPGTRTPNLPVKSPKAPPSIVTRLLRNPRHPLQLPRSRPHRRHQVGSPLGWTC